MCRQASRAAILAGIIAAHVLVLRFFPAMRLPRMSEVPQPPLVLLLLPAAASRQARRSGATRMRPAGRPVAEAPSREHIARHPLEHAPSAGSRAERRAASAGNPAATISAAAGNSAGVRKSAAAGRAAPAGNPPRAPIDWLGEAGAVVADRAQRAADAARRAGALSRWRAHVMPSPLVPHGPEFRWDYAATHRVVVTPGRGIVINFSDRCSILISAGAILPFCAIGHLPVYGDLFEHMNDPPKLGDWMNH